MHPARCAEGHQHDRPGNPGMGGDGQGVAGVVIEPGQDLGVRAVGERVVGEVGLPALVRHVCLEPDVGRLRPLGRARGDQSGPAQVPADGRSRHFELVAVLQAPGDGLRPGVQALPGQFLAQPDDQVGRLVADRGRGGLRPPGPRLERCLALGLVAVQQRVDPGAGDPVSPRDLADRALFDSDGGDDQPSFRHSGSVQPTGPSPGEGTPLTVLDVLRHPVLDVLNLDTARRTHKWSDLGKSVSLGRRPSCFGQATRRYRRYLGAWYLCRAPPRPREFQHASSGFEHPEDHIQGRAEEPAPGLDHVPARALGGFRRAGKPRPRRCRTRVLLGGHRRILPRVRHEN